MKDKIIEEYERWSGHGYKAEAMECHANMIDFIIWLHNKQLLTEQTEPKQMDAEELLREVFDTYVKNQGTSSEFIVCRVYDKGIDEDDIWMRIKKYLTQSKQSEGENVIIPLWKFKIIEDALRLTHIIYKTYTKETAYDRVAFKAYEYAKEYLTQSQQPESEGEKYCNMCGQKLTLIRGRYPKEPKRLVCACCATEKLEASIENDNIGKSSNETQSNK